MSKSTSGLNIVRAYELSWLNSQGMPQIAVLEIYQDHNKPNINTWQLKEFLESINNASYIDISALRVAIEDFVNKDGGLSDSSIKITPQQQFHEICFDTKFEGLPQSITQGLRFICPKTGQPFIGMASVYYKQDTDDMDISPLFNNILQRLRNQKLTTKEYTSKLLECITQFELSEFILVINLNRRGGISQTSIRSNTDIDFNSLSQRGVLE